MFKLRIFPCLHKHKLAHLALTLAGLQGAMLIAAHHYSFIGRHTPSFGQFNVTITLASTIAKDITGR